MVDCSHWSSSVKSFLIAMQVSYKVYQLAALIPYKFKTDTRPMGTSFDSRFAVGAVPESSTPA